MTVLRETTIFPSSVLFLVLKIISYNHSPTPNIHEVSQTLWVLLASQALGPQSLQEKFKVCETQKDGTIWSQSYGLGEKSSQAGAARQALHGLPTASGQSPFPQAALPSPGLDPSQPTGMTFFREEKTRAERDWGCEQVRNKSSQKNTVYFGAIYK